MTTLHTKIRSVHQRNFLGWLLVEYIRYWIVIKIPGIVLNGFINCIQGQSIVPKTWCIPWVDFFLSPLGLAIGYAAATWYRSSKTKQLTVRKEGESLSAHPLSAEFCLWLFLHGEGREAAIGDTNEKFDMMLERFGPRRARLWYWGEVARSAWPLVSYLGERLLKWTFLGSAFDWLRRHI